MKYDCIITAAGSGKRSELEYNKVFHKLSNETVIELSAKHFINDPDCHKVIIVISKDELSLFEELNMDAKVVFVSGGKERSDSVSNGLAQVESPYVMVHDGARPYLSEVSLNLVKSNLLNNDGVVLMTESIDTSKIVIDGYIEKTIDRSILYNAQTPQAFKTSILKEAYRKLKNSNIKVTDDAQVVEVFTSAKIKVVEGDYNNIKLTVSEDFKI